MELADNLPDIFDRLRAWAARSPERILLSEPTATARRSISYGEALAEARVMHRQLAEKHGLRKGGRVATLAPAGIDALILKLACLAGGFVHVALPPFAFGKGAMTEAARPLLEVAQPKLILAPSGHPAIGGMGAYSLRALVDACMEDTGDEIEDEVVAPGDWAAIFFTSGSTGAPKGVPITRAMISSNQAAIAAMWPFMTESPVLVDWLPWHHVFGGLDNVFKIIWNGGTMHVDAPPGPSSIEATMRLMEDVSPTMHIGVPLGLRLLLDHLERDEHAANAFTRRLRAVFFAGAGIDAELWQRLLNFRGTHGNFEILSGYGATEAASTICLSPAPLERPGELGHPLPGHRIALVETDGRTELRVDGPNLAPCYLIEGREVSLPLDEYGFYRTGDAALLGVRSDGLPVFAFDGRLAEDFKLSSGVKVRAGSLRAKLMTQCAPLAADIVVAGENREQLVALVFPTTVGDEGLTHELAARIGVWNKANGASSTRISRFALAPAPADRTRGELSDKGQIVQSRYLRNHADLFDALHAGGGYLPIEAA
ncbi:AMP-binding protein [Mesorhizobium sp. DCY119]|uniref:AMP-binding protein n=1 Tax=Mesorhizobium sp. DCY119 TaxID=2108445 RepID=UPI001FDFFA48|nr:AMP-binding protein [Mesorhizobium sp. DCY119]